MDQESNGRISAAAISSPGTSERLLCIWPSCSTLQKKPHKAREKAEAAGVRVEWIHGDACRFSLEKRFDAAVCICEGAFGLLQRGDGAIDQPLAILRIWGGTAGNWGKRPIDLDEIEIMVVARQDATHPAVCGEHPETA